MKVAIILLNEGRGSGVVAKEHGDFLLSQGHIVHFMHPNVGKGIKGANNKDVFLNKDVIPVHEYLPSAKDTQKARVISSSVISVPTVLTSLGP